MSIFLAASYLVNEMNRKISNYRIRTESRMHAKEAEDIKRKRKSKHTIRQKKKKA